jgi:hypothetical protein
LPCLCNTFILNSHEVKTCKIEVKTCDIEVKVYDVEVKTCVIV